MLELESRQVFDGFKGVFDEIPIGAVFACFSSLNRVADKDKYVYDPDMTGPKIFIKADFQFTSWVIRGTEGWIFIEKSIV